MLTKISRVSGLINLKSRCISPHTVYGLKFPFLIESLYQRLSSEQGLSRTQNTLCQQEHCLYVVLQAIFKLIYLFSQISAFLMKYALIRPYKYAFMWPYRHFFSIFEYIPFLPNETTQDSSISALPTSRSISVPAEETFRTKSRW